MADAGRNAGAVTLVKLSYSNVPALVHAANLGAKGRIDLRFERNAGRLSICEGASLKTITLIDLIPAQGERNHRRFIAAVTAGQLAVPDFNLVRCCRRSSTLR